ncbi:alpha/beta fold hydrolase [Gordonia insulae]|uniref:Haloalkane dehalogenase 2 n=1 Tax=Gordonia insulae TaxID=2420509 RepID=A0A3G8JI38_9ACTN|nr:alpha/beta hydrolase [Gordonia insulae]AZG44704.1 Haloalkane dehalogenase 2 [Gordonia insulae]
MARPSSGSPDSTPQRAETSLGPIEFVDHGSGPPVLFIHGSPGGFDQGALMTGFLTDTHRVVAVSRPGYLNTPISEANRSPQSQATQCAELMTALGIEEFAVMCWSGGGPTAYALAAAHPRRVNAVVAIAAVSTEFDPAGSLRGRVALGEEKMLFNRVGRWFATTLADKAPGAAISTLLSGEGDLTRAQAKELAAGIMDDEQQRTFATALFDTVSGSRKPGFENDFDQFATLRSPLGEVVAPVLLVHAKTDADVPYDQTLHASGSLPDARLLVIEVGTHLSAWLGPDAAEIQAAITRHLAPAAR